LPLHSNENACNLLIPNDGQSGIFMLPGEAAASSLIAVPQLIVANGYNHETGTKAVAEDAAEALAFGRLSIADPDLPQCFRLSAPPNIPDESTFYSGGERRIPIIRRLYRARDNLPELGTILPTQLKLTCIAADHRGAS
jgi:hypothetical protein